MPIEKVLYMVAGVISFFGMLLVALLIYVWRERKKSIDDQLDLGKKNFEQQTEFNLYVRKQLSNQQSIVNAFQTDFGTWKAITSKISKTLESHSKTNEEVLIGFRLLSSQVSEQQLEIDLLKKSNSQ